MKEIPISKGRTVFVDDEDYEELSKFKWSCLINGNTCYARRGIWVNGKQLGIAMHQQIMGTFGKGRMVQVDHADGNGLNNTRENLRICTPSQNQRNRRLRIDNPTGYVGVGINENGKYRASIQLRGKTISLGTFRSPILAAKVHDKVSRYFYGEFAFQNFPTREEIPTIPDGYTLRAVHALGIMDMDLMQSIWEAKL